MPRASSLLVAFAGLAGCNQVLGLPQTEAIDAAYFDASRAVCPALGTPPMFTEELHQVLITGCTDYTVSMNGHALARCDNVISEGPLDGDVAPAPGFEPPPDTVYEHPRLGPDGKLAVVRAIDTVTHRVYFATLARSDVGWQKTGEFMVAGADTFALLSSPTRDGRLLVSTPTGLHELASDSNGTWSEVGFHDFADLGLLAAGDSVALTADGHRAVLSAQPPGSSSLALVYIDRASVDEPFSKAIVLAPLEYFPNGFLLEDCSRLYVSTLATVFYVKPPGS